MSKAEARENMTAREYDMAREHNGDTTVLRPLRSFHWRHQTDILAMPMGSPSLTNLDRQRLRRAAWRPALIAAVPLVIVWGLHLYSLAFPSHGRTTPDPSETAATWGIAVVVSLLVIPIALFRVVTILRLARVGIPVLGRPLLVLGIHKMGKVPVNFGYVVDGKVYVRATDVSEDIAGSYTAATRVLIVYHPRDPWIWQLAPAAESKGPLDHAGAERRYRMGAGLPGRLMRLRRSVMVSALPPSFPTARALLTLSRLPIPRSTPDPAST